MLILGGFREVAPGPGHLPAKIWTSLPSRDRVCCWFSLQEQHFARLRCYTYFGSASTCVQARRWLLIQLQRILRNPSASSKSPLPSAGFDSVVLPCLRVKPPSTSLLLLVMQRPTCLWRHSAHRPALKVCSPVVSGRGLEVDQEQSRTSCHEPWKPGE